MKRGGKKDKVFYYVGWGIAYGTFAGGMFSVLLLEHLVVILLMGSVFGAVIGAVFGKMKNSMQKTDSSKWKSHSIKIE